MIDVEKTLAMLKESNLHYGLVFDDGDLEKPYAIDIQTEPLPIAGGAEYSLAMQIAEKYNVNLFEQDFSRGGEKPNYKPVFGVTCKETNEL